MLWFRVGAVISILAVLLWSCAVIWAIISMFTYGSTLQSIVDDPTKNGTAVMYVAVCVVELLITASAVFGLIIAFKVWRNNYQIDHGLRHFFIIWLGMWGSGMVMLLSISIYMLMRGKDHQENMAVLYESFQRHAQDQKFVSTLEKYQKEVLYGKKTRFTECSENQCCGISNADDWLILQLRQFPGAGGVGIGMGYGMGGGLDSAFMMNPSTGRCHFIPPTMPPGCGIRIQEDIIYKVRIYAACSISQVLVAMVAGVLSWYCFFYWLEKEVIVIPEDEVSNIIIIEPASSSSLNVYSRKFVKSHHRHPRGSRSMTESEFNSATAILRHDSARGKNSWNAQESFRVEGRSSYDRKNTWSNSRLRNDLPYGQYLRNANYSEGARGSRLRSRSHHSVIHLTSAEILREQEMALGGHVLAEMHVAHRSTQILRLADSRNGKHHATVAIVRNKQPRPKKGLVVKGSRHGQTGNLAKDIADMSGSAARGYLKDVLVPLMPPGVRPKAIKIPLGARVHTGHHAPSVMKHLEIDKNKAQDLIENIIAAPNHPSRVETEPSVVVGRHGEVELHSHNQNVTKPHILQSLRHREDIGHHHHGSLPHGHGSHVQNRGSHEHGQHGSHQHQEGHHHHHGLNVGNNEQRGSYYHRGVRGGGLGHTSGHHGPYSFNSRNAHGPAHINHGSVSHHHYRQERPGKQEFDNNSSDQTEPNGSSRIGQGRHLEYHGRSIQEHHASNGSNRHGFFNRKFDRPTTVLYKSTKPFNEND